MTCTPNTLFPMPEVAMPMTVEERAETYGTSGLAEAELLAMLGLSLEQAAAAFGEVLGRGIAPTAAA